MSTSRFATHVDGGHEDDDSADHRQVPGVHRGDQDLAQAGPGEDAFGDHCTGEQGTQRPAAEGDPGSTEWRSTWRTRTAGVPHAAHPGGQREGLVQCPPRIRCGSLGRGTRPAGCPGSVRAGAGRQIPVPPTTGKSPRFRAKTTSRMTPSQYCGRPAAKASSPEATEERNRFRLAVPTITTRQMTQATSREVKVSTMVGAYLVADHLGDGFVQLVRNTEVSRGKVSQEPEVLHDQRIGEAVFFVDRCQFRGGSFLDLPVELVQQQRGPVAGQQRLDQEGEGGCRPEDSHRGQQPGAQAERRPPLVCRSPRRGRLAGSVGLTRGLFAGDSRMLTSVLLGEVGVVEHRLALGGFEPDVLELGAARHRGGLRVQAHGDRFVAEQLLGLPVELVGFLGGFRRVGLQDDVLDLGVVVERRVGGVRLLARCSAGS